MLLYAVKCRNLAAHVNLRVKMHVDGLVSFFHATISQHLGMIIDMSMDQFMARSM